MVCGRARLLWPTAADGQEPLADCRPARNRWPARVQRGRLFAASPLSFVASGRSLGERGLANRNQQVMADFCRECVVLFLEPDKCSLQVTHTLLKAAHFRDHARIRAADVAEANDLNPRKVRVFRYTPGFSPP